MTLYGNYPNEAAAEERARFVYPLALAHDHAWTDHAFLTALADRYVVAWASHDLDAQLKIIRKQREIKGRRLATIILAKRDDADFDYAMEAEACGVTVRDLVGRG